MTKAVRSRILKDANGCRGADLDQHLLRSHVHLTTNCVHLKHRIHLQQSPVMHDRPLRRELIALQRTRSLRDPSASPPTPSRPSHLAVPDLVFKDCVQSYASKLGGRRRRSSAGTASEQPRGGRVGSPLLETNVGMSKYDPRDLDDGDDLTGRARGKKTGAVVNDLSGSDGGRHFLPEESNWNNKLLLHHGFPPGISEKIDGKISVTVKGKPPPRREANAERFPHHKTTFDEPEPSAHGSCSGFNGVKRHRIRRPKKMQVLVGARGGSRAQNDSYVASSSSVKGSVHPDFYVQEGKEKVDCAEEDFPRGSMNRCGIPWNWSRLHHRGKSFLDIAGRSLSCGLSDPRLKRGWKDASNSPDAADDSSLYSKSESQALPLLVDGSSGSQGSSGNNYYSGELDIFADSLLNHGGKSDIPSEIHSDVPVKLRGKPRGRHQNLAQKYMPKTFRDLIGQNLVSQALSNAVAQKKVGLLYVFYGPRGTGKTSCAHIFARALNCLSLEHTKPCGFCGSCVAHDMGKSRNVKVVGGVNNFNFESFVDLLDSMMVPQLPSLYRVFIFDDCDTLSADCWNALAKVIDRASRRLVFILICSRIDVLPHIIISRCQKFFFPKLKDSDITYALEWISNRECLEIDKDAIKLIASRSDGSLRDAEMTIEQLSLLGQRISVSLVQELAGLISDDKLVHLLDLALSADTVNTVKNLREIMETGVEPLALMSQLATMVTDILAGTYDFSRDIHRRKFFRRQTLSREDMERLRQALKTLSEAEKQLRVSSDKLIWLTAALLQLAPDPQYMLPTSSAYSSFNDNNAGWAAKRSSNEYVSDRRDLFGDVGNEKHVETSDYFKCGREATGSTMQRNPADTGKNDRGRASAKGQTEIQEIWLEVLEKMQISSIKEFMYQEGQLISVSYSAAPTVQLIFSSSRTKSKAEKFKAHILQAFESVLGTPVIIELGCEPEKNMRLAASTPYSKSGPSHFPRMGYDGIGRINPHSGVNARASEIEEVAASPSNLKSTGHAKGDERFDGKASSKKSETGALSDTRRPLEQNRCQTLVRSKVSLAHMIQQVEGSTHQNAWTKRKAISIAEKLEQENLRLEPSSRRWLCWRSTRATQRKLSRWKSIAKKRPPLLKLVPCGICQTTKP